MRYYPTMIFSLLSKYYTVQSNIVFSHRSNTNTVRQKKLENQALQNFIKVSILVYTELKKTNQVSWIRRPFWAHLLDSVWHTDHKTRDDSSSPFQLQPNSETSTPNSPGRARRYGPANEDIRPIWPDFRNPGR